MLQGAQYEDSDSSRGEDLPGEHAGSGSSNSSTANERTVADLTRTCSNLQTQVLLLAEMPFSSNAFLGGAAAVQPGLCDPFCVGAIPSFVVEPRHSTPKIRPHDGNQVNFLLKKTSSSHNVILHCVRLLGLPFDLSL